MKTININETPYPFKRTIGAMMRIEESTGLSLTNLGNNVPMKVIGVIAIECINSGYMAQGLETRLSESFLEELDLPDLEQIMEAFAGEAEKKQKRKATK
jgi:hypothetical protein